MMMHGLTNPKLKQKFYVTVGVLLVIGYSYWSASASYLMVPVFVLRG